MLGLKTWTRSDKNNNNNNIWNPTWLYINQTILELEFKLSNSKFELDSVKKKNICVAVESPGLGS